MREIPKMSREADVWIGSGRVGSRKYFQTLEYGASRRCRERQAASNNKKYVHSRITGRPNSKCSVTKPPFKDRNVACKQNNKDKPRQTQFHNSYAKKTRHCAYKANRHEKSTGYRIENMKVQSRKM